MCWIYQECRQRYVRIGGTKRYQWQFEVTRREPEYWSTCLLEKTINLGSTALGKLDRNTFVIIRHGKFRRPGSILLLRQACFGIGKYLSCSLTVIMKFAHQLAEMQKGMTAIALAWDKITALETEVDGLMFLTHFRLGGAKRKWPYG